MDSRVFTYRVNPSDSYLDKGARLVCTVSQVTGFPDPEYWSEEALYEHTRERQRKAYATIVVTAFNDSAEGGTGKSEELVVGHSLLV